MNRIKVAVRLSKSGFTKEVPISYEKVESLDKLRNILSH